MSDAVTSHGPRLLAVADLHVGHRGNAGIVDTLVPRADGDWLIVAGDVAERLDEVEHTLARLADRFATVIWVPGNHELWANPRTGEPVGTARYEHLVDRCRALGVLTPEDEFPVWHGLTVAPLFTLYDYTFRPAGARTKDEGLAIAREAGVVCTDEYLLDPTPYPSIDAWCADRLAYARRRLDAVTGPTVLVNHWPLVREPTDVLWYPEFAQWCGSTATADWPTRYRARAVVHGHLHIPRVITVDEVPHVEASVGYPREWGRHGLRPEVYVDVFDPVRPDVANARALGFRS